MLSTQILSIHSLTNNFYQCLQIMYLLGQDICCMFSKNKNEASCCIHNQAVVGLRWFV